MPYKYPGSEYIQWVDVFQRMYRERIMFVSASIEDNFANSVIAVLLHLEMENANDPVSMYFNSPGPGNIKAGLAMYDTMRIMPYDIMTVNTGMCASTSGFLVASGTPGKRFALPNSRFFMQNPRMDPRFDEEGRVMTRPMQATEMQLEVEEIVRDKKRMLEGLSVRGARPTARRRPCARRARERASETGRGPRVCAPRPDRLTAAAAPQRFTGRSVDTLRDDFSRDFYLDAAQAKAFGVVDEVMEPKPAKASSKADISFGTFGSGEKPFGAAAGEEVLPDASGIGEDAPPPDAEPSAKLLRANGGGLYMGM